MSVAKHSPSFEVVSKIPIVLGLFLILLPFLYLVGCGDQVHLPSAQQLADFENAGPVLPTVDMDRQIRAKIGGVPLPDEVLEITMPTILHVLTAEKPDGAEELAPYICRVSGRGTIALPVVGEIKVVEKTLAEIESAIIDSYYPKYAATRPPVFVRLVERVEQPLFTVLGLVNSPGNFPYPPGARYNVMQAVGAAEGLDQNGEPRYATVYRLRSDGTIARATFEIVNMEDGSGLTEALSVLIKPGDIVAVEHTPRTRTNRFLEQIFNVNFGAYVPVWR